MKGKPGRSDGRNAAVGLNILAAFEAGEEIIGCISTRPAGDEYWRGYTVRLRPIGTRGAGLIWALELWLGADSNFVNRGNLMADHEYEEDFLRSLIKGEVPLFKHVQGGAAIITWMTQRGLEMLEKNKSQHH